MTQQLAADGLPPLAPPDATDDERAGTIVARMVARHGAPSIEDYRRVYQQSGVPWPGDKEIRRRHPVARGVIGGKVVDASALAALVRGRLAAVAWFATRAGKTVGGGVGQE